MSSRRFILSSPPLSDQAQLIGGEAHHLANVLRAKPGKQVELVDPCGTVWKGVISSIEPGVINLVQVRLLCQAEKPQCRLVLAQSLCRAEKLETIIQKTTELGVDEIYLLEAERSILKIVPEKSASKMARWENILLSATKQCRRTSIPILHPPLKCRDFLTRVPEGLRLILSEHGGASLKTTLRGQAIRTAIYAIGPEGGWTSQEEMSFHVAGFLPVSLGANILRTETAAIAGMSILQYELNRG